MTGAWAPLPWQQESWSRLQQTRAQGRLAHAWLVAGPAGVGKRHFIQAWTASLLCEAPAAGGQACGQCRSCTQLAAGSHPNRQWLCPQVDEKTGREKRDISIEQLRELSQRLVLSSYYGQLKIGVVDPGDALNANGVNALLKIIEEPPQASLLVLISERPMALAPTLRSRCRRLDFHRPPEQEALRWLQQTHPALAVEPQLLAEAGGAPLRLQHWLETGLAERRRRWRDELVAIALEGRDPVAAAGAVAREREETQAWLSALLWLCLEVLRSRVAPEDHGDRTTRMLAARISGAGLESLIGETYDGLRRLGANANAQLLVESLMIAWWRWTRPRRNPVANRSSQ